MILVIEELYQCNSVTLRKRKVVTDKLKNAVVPLFPYNYPLSFPAIVRH